VVVLTLPAHVAGTAEPPHHQGAGRIEVEVEVAAGAVDNCEVAEPSAGKFQLSLVSEMVLRDLDSTRGTVCNRKRFIFTPNLFSPLSIPLVLAVQEFMAPWCVVEGKPTLCALQSAFAQLILFDPNDAIPIVLPMVWPEEEIVYDK
jgi:hypothetical protein